MNQNMIVESAMAGSGVAIVMTLLAACVCYAQFRSLFGEQIHAAWPTGRRVLLVVFAALAGLGALVVRFMNSVRAPRMSIQGSQDDMLVLIFWTVVGCCALAFGFLLSVLFIAKLYEKYVNARLSEAEQKPGAPGFRAWLAPANLFFVLAISACLSLGLDYSFWSILLIGALAILAYPMMVTFSGGAGAAAEMAAGEASAELSPERQRVMRLLEQGRITAEEGAELLNALAATVTPAPPAEPFTSARKLMLVGAAIVLVGFFLPWFNINIGQKMQEMTQGLQQGIQQRISGMPGGEMAMQMMPANVNFTQSFSLPSTRITGGDVSNGLGWIILALGVGAAAVPYVLTGVRRETRKHISIGALAVGGVIVMFLVSKGFNDLSLGLPIVLAGYLLQLFALLSENRRPPLVTAPVAAAV